MGNWCVLRRFGGGIGGHATRVGSIPARSRLIFYEDCEADDEIQRPPDFGVGFWGLFPSARKRGSDAFFVGFILQKPKA